MFSHIFLGVNHFDRSVEFYAGVMSLLGHQLKFCDAENNMAAWMAPGEPRPLMVIGTPFDGNPAVGVRWWHY